MTGNDKIDGVIRHTLTFASGIAATFGVASTMQIQAVQDTVGQISTAVGVIGGAVGLIWSIFAKKKS